MVDVFLSSFERPSEHEAVSDIIRHRSTNDTDVREALLHGLDLSCTRAVLDLGCGFGFITEALAQRVPPEAGLVGVDACATNAEAYLARVAGAGRTGQFVCRRIEARLDWPDHSFDLVVASYALYFFPGVLPEVVRVLAPGGLFLAVTHTEQSCRDLTRLIGLPDSDTRLLALIRRFSAENGAPMLRPWFAEVERVDYRNSLVFEAAQEDELLAYLRFKLVFLAPDGSLSNDLSAALARAARTLRTQGRVILEKSDAAFRCRPPLCR
jgi:SAM-dependent methyltransferase